MKKTGALLQANDLAITPVRDAQGLITSGVVIGDVTLQNQGSLLVAQPGSFKLFPSVGIGIDDMILDNDDTRWRQIIRQQYQADGLTIQVLDIKNGKINVSASYR
jgi:hypothetical protein